MPGLSYGDAVANITTSINAPTQLATSVNTLAPTATVYHGATPTAPLPDFVASGARGTNLQQFGSFLGSMVKEVGHLAGGAEQWLYHNSVNMVEAPFKLGAGLAKGFQDRDEISSVNAQNQQFTGRLDTLNNLYKSGKISSKDYSDNLKILNQDQNNLVTESDNLNTRIKADQNATQKALWDTGATIVTLLTAGAGAAVDTGYGAAAKFLASDAADAPLLAGASKLNELATNPELFGKLSAANRDAIQRSVAEVVAANTGKMTAAQISRSSVANLALKYPIYFNMLSSTGDQVYKELDSAKYGDAVRSLAFNALLLLSGGPIGHALKYGGEAAKSALAHTFGESSFIDEISGAYKAGDRSEVTRLINSVGTPESKLDTSKMIFFDEKGNLQKLTDEEVKSKLIANYSALEATNLKATGAKEPVAAAWRVINGMASIAGNSMSEVPASEGIINDNNFAEAQRYVSTRGKALGLGDITVGRVDARQLRGIALSAHAGDTPEEQIAAFNSLAASNPNYAWANSDTLRKQVISILKTDATPEDKAQQIANIKASFQVKGFGEAESKALSNAGYIAIKPKSLEAPFVEGTGKLSSAFAEDGPLWTKSVTPIPVMSHIGDMLTGLGLSPNASVQRAYQIYNANLAESLNELNINEVDSKIAEAVKPVEKATKEALPGGLSKAEYDAAIKAGATPEMLAKGSVVEGTVSSELSKGEVPTEGRVKTTAAPKEAQSRSDFINKVLSDYRRNPTRGRIVKALPITDYRQMTNSDIVEAFKNKGIVINRSDAGDIGKAINQAWLQMPLAVRGLGDRAVDLNFKLNPLAGRYSRLQSGLRFAWNPFYQNLRAIPKTEILASAKGGGYSNAIFSGEYRQINPARELMRKLGIFEEKGGLGNVVAGAEGVEATGDIGRNLGRRLLPQQERSIAGLVVSKANKEGLTVEQYIQNDPEGVRDMVQAIAEYDRNANFLNSPMARTLNLAIFPFRFEVKVGTAMAKALARTSPITQVAVIKGMMNAHTWLNSPEGQAWYSHNAEAIGLFEYMTPLQTLGEVGDLLGLQHNAIGQYGELGGLPFGFIPQILDAEGLTHFNQPGVDAKTGQVFPKYIPTDTRGQTETAIQNFLGSLFTYPGATIGAPSKASLTRMAAMGITGANKAKDLKSVTPTNLSGQQRSYSQTIQGLNGTLPQAAPQAPPATNQPVPSLPTPATTPEILHPSTSKTPKKKKSEFTPQLLPGQTTLGQL